MAARLKADGANFVPATLRFRRSEGQYRPFVRNENF
jgi:hypothetical protein